MTSSEMQPPPDVESFLPLTPAVFHVLLALADGPSHGYAVMKEVETRTRGRVRLGPGTLYGITKRLLADGWVAEVKAGSPAAAGRRGRRDFRLTALGRAVAAAEMRRLEDLLELARGKRWLPVSPRQKV